MEDIDIEILALYGIVICFLELIVAWLWSHTISVASGVRYGVFAFLSIVTMVIFVAILWKKK